MPSKVILQITKGELAGKKFIYSGKEQLFIGRQEDCTIVLPDKSVSRYHCMMEVTPPYVTVRDFGSLNGTFLNGEKIGQRDRSISAEEAQKEYHEEFELHDGDTLSLGKHCELKLHTVLAKCCTDCGVELPEAEEAENEETSLDNVSQAFVNDKREPICEACYLEHNAKKREKELAALEKEKAEKEKAEASRLEKERLERERLEQERLEKERSESEKKRKEAEAVAEVLAKKLRATADKAAREEAEREHMKAAAAAAALKRAEEELEREQEQQRKAEEQRRIEEEQRKHAAEEQQRKHAAEEEQCKRTAEENARREAEQKQLEKAEPRQRIIQKKCIVCGKPFSPGSQDDNLCPKCAEDKDKILDAMIMQILGAAFVQGAKNQGSGSAAFIKGFRKLKRLGAGGMGEVWLVQEERTGKQYALKTMLPQIAADEHAKKSFLREACLGEELKHKNVIEVYKTGCESGMFFILMELCKGGSVDKYMERCGGKLPLDVATYIMLQVLDGLEYAHHAKVSVECEGGIRNATGVVHRDFKPGNIFLADSNKYPVAKVADFGFAKAFETAGLSLHTRTGTAAATPVFQPRQQIINYKYSKPDVDIWAAAASYYNMLTGSFPKNVRGKDIWVEMYTERAVPIRQRDPQIPEKLAAVIDEALVEIPEIGIRSAAELKRRIVSALPFQTKRAVRGVL